MIEQLHVPDLSDDENGVLNGLLKQLEDKSRRNLLRSAHYDGRHAERQVGGVIPPQYTNLALVLGWAGKVVDGLGRRCNLDGMVWADGDLDALGYQELLDSNFLLSELAQGRTDSLIHGVSYLITTQGVDDEPKALVHARDGLHATGDWNVRTRRLDSALSVTSWGDDRQVSGFNLYLPDLTISAEKDSSGWSVDRSEHSWGVPVEPLVYRPRASRRMGRSRITRPVMSLQNAALRALIRLEVHMDTYAVPKLIFLGADESIFKNPDGSMKASWQMVMGRAMGIPDAEAGAQDNGRAAVEQISAESPAPHLSQLNALAKLVAREADLPDSDFAMTDMANPTSADAYNASRENLIAEAEGAMSDWSVPIRRTVARALAIQNGETEIPASWASIKPDWRSPVYLSKSQEADAGSKVVAAVPWLAETTVGLKMLGLSQEQIDLANAERRKGQVTSLVQALTANATAATVADPQVAALAGERGNSAADSTV